MKPATTRRRAVRSQSPADIPTKDAGGTAIASLSRNVKIPTRRPVPSHCAMNILLLNLTRFGDLLQSQAAITDLVRQGHTVAVLCLENFAEAAALLSGVSQIFPLPGSAFLAALDKKQPSGDNKPRDDWPAAFGRLTVLRETVKTRFSPDVVCNLTPSLSARMLARFLAGGGVCSGFAMDEFGFGVHSNSWAAFLQGATVTRGVSPFNVVDMFRKVAERSEGSASPSTENTEKPNGMRASPGDASLRPPTKEILLAMQARLRAVAPDGCKGYVALQLGASEDRRRWPATYFAALGNRLWREEGLCPVLLGSKGEKELVRRYAQAARHPHPFIDMCGETGLTDLAAVLCACRLLVTNDTGTMHYAAGLAMPVLAVFLATAQPFDTGPYREGSCSLEPDMPCHPCSFGVSCPHAASSPPNAETGTEDPEGPPEPCRFAVSPEYMAELALSRLRQGEWQPSERSGSSSARVWLSEYDEEGFMSLRSLSGHESEPRTLWLLLQRHYLRQFLNRERATAFTPRPLPSPLRMPLENTAALAASLSEAADLTSLMLQQGRVLTTRPLPMMRDRFLSTWQKVHACLKTSPYLGALSLLWMQETQAEGQDLPVILSVAEHFHQLLVALNEEITLKNQHFS